MCDFRPLSGLHAVSSVVCTMTIPNDLVYCLSSMNGGHFSTTQMLTQMGRNVGYIPFEDDFLIDKDKLVKMLLCKRPNAILIDYADPMYPININDFVNDLNIPIFYDGSHVLGLIAGGCFESPLKTGVDVLFGNTHKTFPGPQKGVIFYKDLANGLDAIKKMGSSMVSSQHTHHAIALYLSVMEMQVFGKGYAEQIIKNSTAFSKELEEVGFTLCRRKNDYTKTHIVFIDTLITNHLSPQEASRKLFQNKITSNYRKAYGKDLLRVGVQELTRLGFLEKDMKSLASVFAFILIEENQKEALLIISDFLKRKNISFSFDAKI